MSILLAARRDAMGLKEWSDRRQVIRKAKKVKGKPWWEADLKQFVCQYDRVDHLNDELGLASERGWSVKDTSGTDGHINVGRTVTGAVFTGGLTLMLGGSRNKGKITVTWERDAA
jgi:hypothetical protein